MKKQTITTIMCIIKSIHSLFLYCFYLVVQTRDAMKCLGWDQNLVDIYRKSTMNQRIYTLVSSAFKHSKQKTHSRITKKGRNLVVILLTKHPLPHLHLNYPQIRNLSVIIVENPTVGKELWRATFYSSATRELKTPKNQVIQMSQNAMLKIEDDEQDL